MPKSSTQLQELRERLTGLLNDWSSEISAVLTALENQRSAADAQGAKPHAMDGHASDLEELRQRVRDRDIALDYLKKKAKEKDARIADLEKEHQKFRTQTEELERKLGAQRKPDQKDPDDEQDDHRAELEAMRAELAARKSLVKSLRSDAERGKSLEKKLADNRNVIAKLKESIEDHTRTIAELRRTAASWEREYRRLADASAVDGAVSPAETETGSVDEAGTVDGSRTIVIDMTEPLRAAREARLGKTRKR